MTSEESSRATRTKIEIGIVLALSLGASAVYSLVSLIAKITAESGLAAQTATINRPLAEREWLDLTYQLLNFAFGLAPVALVLFLLWQTDRNPFRLIGLDFDSFGKSVIRGFSLAALIGIPGIGLYLLARVLGLSARVVPAELGSYWWVVPILLLAALKAALLEEVIVVGYLFNRLQSLGISINRIIWISSLLRGAYHLYQGFGGFFGNIALGLVFGYAYKKWGRVMPLVAAHFTLDAFAFVGYSALAPFIALP